MNQNIQDTKKAQNALKEAAVMTERINNEAEKREHRALIGEALIEAQLYDEALPTLLGAQSDNTPKTHYLIDAVFYKGPNFCTKFDPMYGDLHIILKPINVKICEHSIFLIIEQKYVWDIEHSVLIDIS